MVDPAPLDGGGVPRAASSATRCSGTSCGGWSGGSTTRRDGSTSALRVAEDRTLRRRRGRRRCTLPDDAVGRHRAPAAPGADASAAWAEVFADYEILQPFPQLGRDVPSDRRGASRRLARFDGRQGPDRQGARPGAARLAARRAAGRRLQGWIERDAARRRNCVAIDLDPGIAVGDVDEFADQTSSIWIADEHGPLVPRACRALRRPRPVTASEILARPDEVTQ